MPKPGTAALESLPAVERASILGALLRAHPELLAEAELLAAGFLSQEDRPAVAEDVADELRALHLSQLADRGGPQWDAVTLTPTRPRTRCCARLCSHIWRTSSDAPGSGRSRPHGRSGLDVLMGLYAGRDEDDNDRVLTHAGTPDAVDNLGSQAIRTMKNAGLDVPEDWLGDTCPAWAR